MRDTVHQEHGRPGDDFHRAAVDYDHQAQEAESNAASAPESDGNRYLKLASIYREMAGIKREAAAMADQERWNDISWERYHELEVRRDRLLDELEARGDAWKKAQDQGFLTAAREYEQQADEAREQAHRHVGAEQAIFKELSQIYDEMAAIKHEAADASQAGRSIDWDHYEALSGRRDTLKNMLERSR